MNNRFYKFYRGSLGFSLVEFAIVIGIVGVLTSVVITSTTAARAKARDERRIGDLREIQLGLALYHDVNRAYPAGNDISALNILVTQKYLPSLPNDPSGTAYEYMLSNGRYCLGATLERTIPVDSANCQSKPSGSVANYKVSR